MLIEAKSISIMYEVVYIGQGSSLLAFHLCDISVTLGDLWSLLSGVWVTLKVSHENKILN